MTAAASPDPMLPECAVVRRVVRETEDTFTLTLEPPSRPGGFRWAPGQFNMLYLFGAGEVPISIAGDPDRGDELVHTIRAVGRVTEPLSALARGEVLGVRGPFGSAWPVDEARGQDVLVVAGGIGLAPLRPVVERLLKRRPDYSRVAILYGARSPAEMLYAKELSAWRGRFDVGVRVIVDRGGPDWRGDVGVVTRLLTRTYFDPEDTVAMICGPEVMMRFVARDLQDRGLPPEKIYLSLERNMKCAVGTCGHCQFGASFVCRDGPVFRYDRVAGLLGVREI